MQSGSFIRTVIILGLFAVLICDYSALICQIYTNLSGKKSESGHGRVEDTAVSDGPLLKRSGATFREDKADLSLDADIDGDDLAVFGGQTKSAVVATIKNACLPKLICELTVARSKDRLSDSERSLLDLISSTTLGTLAEVTSKYHFAAHMGQLITGVDGTGCHVFYPTCPLPGLKVMQILKKVRLR